MLRELGVRELLEEARRLTVDFSACVEKQDLLDLLLSHSARGGATLGGGGAARISPPARAPPPTTATTPPQPAARESSPPQAAAARTTPLHVTNHGYVYATRNGDHTLVVALNVDDVAMPLSLPSLGFAAGEMVAGSGAPPSEVVVDAVVPPHGWLVLAPR